MTEKNNPNLISSTELLIDEDEQMLIKRSQEAHQVIHLAEVALPININDVAGVEEYDMAAMSAKDTVESVKSFFAGDSDFLIDEGLEAMNAKLSKAEYCDGSRTNQAITFWLRMNDIYEQPERIDRYDRVVSTLAWVRAAKLAKDKLSSEERTTFVLPRNVIEEVISNPKLLEDAYKDLQDNQGVKVREFLDFANGIACKVDFDLQRLSSEQASYSNSPDNDKENFFINKDPIIGENKKNLDKLMEDAGLVVLSTIWAPFNDDEMVQSLHLPLKESIGRKAAVAYKRLEIFGGHHLDDSDRIYSIDHGLRALQDRLGDTKYHGPRYDIQQITFALRMHQLISEAKDPKVLERIKNVAIYLRAARIAEIELWRTDFMAGSSEIAKKARDPALLRRANNELSAYGGVVFKKFVDDIGSISAEIVEVSKTVKEHPEWRQR